MTIAYFLNRFKLIIGISFTCLIFGQSLIAQEFKRIPITESTPPKTTPKTTPKIITKITKSSNLTITTEPGAEVSLKLSNGNPIKVIFANEDGIVVFENLKTGNYKVQASKDGFVTKNVDSVDVPPQRTVAINLDLVPITYNLIIETIVSEGEVRFAPAEYKGIDTNNKVTVTAITGYAIAPISKGTAKIFGLRKGYYLFDIRPNIPEYQPLQLVLAIPSDLEELEINKNSDQDDPITLRLSKVVELNKQIKTEIRGTAIFSPEVRAAARGKYYSLIIGNNDYQTDLSKLETAVNDAEEIHKILVNQYGFESKLLRNAKRAEIIDEIYSFADRLEPDDSLLIYYAGHGYRNERTEQTFWLPIDASKKSPANWISSDDILSNLRAFPAKHIVIISDSCFAGTLSRDANIDSQAQKDRKTFLLKMLDKKSRRLIASGGNEPVADTGENGHSPFANALIRGLNLMEQTEFTASELFNNFILEKVTVGSNQTPIYRTLPNLNDDGGDFVFIRKK